MTHPIPSSEGCPQGGVGNPAYGATHSLPRSLQTHPYPSLEGIQIPDTPTSPTPPSMSPLLTVQNLKVHFPQSGGFLSRQQTWIKAVDGLTFDVYPGETLGLVGESGCGKSTTGQAILQMVPPTDGTVHFEGVNITTLGDEALRKVRQRLQMIFQDPYGSLNPRMTVGDILAEPLDIFGVAQGQTRQQRVAELMDMVGLNPSFIYRYPHEFSGGQRQRIVIGRALALNPAFVVCDEPIAALDVSIQAQIRLVVK